MIVRACQNNIEFIVFAFIDDGGFLVVEVQCLQLKNWLTLFLGIETQCKSRKSMIMLFGILQKELWLLRFINALLENVYAINQLHLSE